MKCSFVKTLCLLITLFVVGCKVETPEGVLPPEKMENVIYDYHLVQAITTEYMPLNYEKKMHINYVFEKHGITKEQFDSSLVWYTRYPRRMHRIYASLEKRTMEELLSMLTERQQMGLRLHFGMEDGVCHSLEQISIQFGVSKERVRQIERQAMEKLQKLGANLGLEDFLE